MRVLVLSGTADGRRLAAALEEDRRFQVVSSFAGRVGSLRLPDGEVRIGGFGGPEQLAVWLGEEGIDAVVDATHPFAERISTSAVRASALAGVRLLRLERPGWRERQGDRWHWADSLEHAARLVPELGERVFLTTGRQGVATFAQCDRTWFLIRCIEAPEPPLPAHHELLRDRGPYTLEGDLELLDTHRIDLLVTKDSGGEETATKLDAARERACPVVVVRRPKRPAAPLVATVEDAIDWLHRA
jgi:precorrin-6A/cobalt-precorrin-6A reductase